MTKVVLAWKEMLLKQIGVGKPLSEVLSVMGIGMDRFLQERRTDPDFNERFKDTLASRPSRRLSW